MKYQEYLTSQAGGVILGANLTIDGKTYVKGHKLKQSEVLAIKAAGIKSIFGAEYEDGDIEYQTALTQIAAVICAKGLGYTIEDGILNIAAAQDGVFVVDDNRLNKFNSFNDNVILNTISSYHTVKTGDIVAKMEILPPLLAQSEVDDLIFRLSGNTALLTLQENKKHTAAVVYIHSKNEEDIFTSAYMRLLTSLADYKIDFKREFNADYNTDSLRNVFYQAFNSGMNLFFVMMPFQGMGKNDLIAQALKEYVDEIYNYTIPVLGSADLIIAQKGGRRVIVLPHNYAKIDSPEVNKVIWQTIFSEHLSSSSFNNKKSAIISLGGHIGDAKKLVTPTATKASTNKASIGAVVLAAGQSRRAGTTKLLVEGKDGLPMFMHAVNAAVASNAKPVFVITGHRHEELEEWLQKLDVNIIYNPAYETGVRTSIQLGLKAMPSACDGAILLPADMPNITSSELNKLIGKMDLSTPKNLCFLTHKGVKYNPVLWSKALYDKADLIPENSAYRVVFAEHADYSHNVEVKDENILKDLNFPNDVKEYAKK